MADTDILFTIIVNADKPNKTMRLNLFLADFPAYAILKRINAITPINKTLNNKSKFRS